MRSKSNAGTRRLGPRGDCCSPTKLSIRNMQIREREIRAAEQTTRGKGFLECQELQTEKMVRNLDHDNAPLKSGCGPANPKSDSRARRLRFNKRTRTASANSSKWALKS